MTKPSEIPPKIDDDRYDKLARKVWELEQEYAWLDKATAGAVDLDMIFDKQRIIEEQISDIKKNMEFVTESVITLLHDLNARLQRRNGTVKK